jgi:hypothetical protein
VSRRQTVSRIAIILVSFLVGVAGYFVAKHVESIEESTIDLSRSELSKYEPDEPCREDLTEYRFLTKSKILKEEKIKTYFAKATEDGVLVVATCAPLKGPFFSATSKGIITLTGDSSTGEEYTGFGYGTGIPGSLFKGKPSGEVAPFFFQGQSNNVSVTWEAAHKKESAEVCPDNDKKFKKLKNESFAIEGLPGLVSISKFQKIKGTYECVKFKIDLFNGKCNNWIISKFGCTNNYDDNGPYYRDILGLLEIKKGSRQEKWIIFNTSAYESHIRTSFPYSHSQGIQSKDAENLVF